LPIVLPVVLLCASVVLGLSATARAPQGLQAIALGCLVLYVGCIAACREEAVLGQLSGYAQYAARTARLIPGVW
jgi:protein-S-isoprenylcysteine O-methyltransferase Ste14